MKKFTTRRGFTLVEVMVAFVIFALMASMIAMLLDTTKKAKRESLNIEAEIDAQRSEYYQKDLDMEYKGTNSSNLQLSFDNGTTVDISYEVGSTSTADDDYLLSLDYFIGDVDYEMKASDGKKDKGSGGAGSVMNRLDTRVYGAKDIDKLTIKVEDKGYDNGGYVYKFSVLAQSDSLKGSDNEYFASYRFLFPTTILDYGYVDAGGMLTAKSSNTTHKCEITATAPKLLRVGSLMYIPWSQEYDSMFKSPKYVDFWVKFASPLPADLTEVFGVSASDQTTCKVGDLYVLTPFEEFPIYDNDGNIIYGDDGKMKRETHINIFGAFPKEVVDDT